MARRNKRGYRQFRPGLSFEGLETRRVLAADFSNVMVVVSPANETGPDVAALVGEDSSALVGPFLKVDEQVYAFSAGDAVTWGVPEATHGRFASDSNDTLSISDAFTGSNDGRVEFATFGDNILRRTASTPIDQGVAFGGVATAGNDLTLTAAASSLNFTIDDNFASLTPLFNSLNSFLLDVSSITSDVVAVDDNAVLVSVDTAIGRSQSTGRSVMPSTIDIETNGFLSAWDASIVNSGATSQMWLGFDEGTADIMFYRFGDDGGVNDQRGLDLSDLLESDVTPTLIENDGTGSDRGFRGIDAQGGSVGPPGTGTSGSDLPNTFGVEPNRDIVPGGVDDGLTSDADLTERSVATIDIAQNHVPRLSADWGGWLQSYEGSLIAQTVPFETTDRVSFRVEPMMARAHRIRLDSQVPSEPMAKMTDEAITQLGADDLAAANMHAHALDDVQRLIVVLASHTHPDAVTEHHQTAEQSQVNVETRHASQSPIALEKDATIPIHDRSRWQTMVDMVLAGAAGAMIYGGREDQREDQREVTRSKRDFLRRR